MELFAHLMFGMFGILLINSAIKYPFDKWTMYKKSDLADQAGWFVILFLFFGVFMLPFIKPIKQFRKIHYIKNKIHMYKFWVIGHRIHPPNPNGKVWPEYYEIDDKLHEEYMNNQRYIKLIKLQRKSKRNVFIRKLWQ